MKVIVIREDSHGFIGVAANEKSAQIYVINSWVQGDFYVYYKDKDMSIKEAFGENWKEILKNMPFEDFNELMNDTFCFREETLIEE